jgi:hypothetical protein
MRNRTLTPRKKDFLPIEGEDERDTIPFHPLVIKPLFKPREILNRNWEVIEVHFQLTIQKSTDISRNLDDAIMFLQKEMKEELIGTLRLIGDECDKQIYLSYQCTVSSFLNKEVLVQLNRLLNTLYAEGKLKEKVAVQRLIGALTSKFNLYSNYSNMYATNRELN